MFDFIKRAKNRIRRRKIDKKNKEVLELEVIEESVQETKVEEPAPIIITEPPKRYGTIKFCSTHGKELPKNRVCSDCAEVAKKTETRDPLNNDMDSNGMHGDHFDKRVNQNRLLKDDCKEKPHNLLRRGYFCHTCEIVLWHQLRWCPRCGKEFDFIKMSSGDMAKSFPNYIVGY